MIRTDTSQVALLHPGDMGASLGAALVGVGHRVVWCSAGRSAATARRADDAGLAAVGDVAALVEDADLVLSVCPPGAAEAVAESVLEVGFSGLYVDANAVSPATAARIAGRVADAGCDFVDGSIIGPPARERGTTRLYLSGERARDVAGLFAGSPLDALPIAGGTGAASALKVAYAAWTKGSGALLLAVRAFARAAAVDEPLLEEWKLSQPQLFQRSETAANSGARKGWRYVGEMEEIAEAFGDVGLPQGFHRAALDVFTHLAGFRHGEPPGIDAIVHAILGRSVTGADTEVATDP